MEGYEWVQQNRPLEKWEWLELYNLGIEFGLDPKKTVCMIKITLFLEI